MEIITRNLALKAPAPLGARRTWNWASKLPCHHSIVEQWAAEYGKTSFLSGKAIVRHWRWIVAALVLAGCGGKPAFEGKSVDELREMLKAPDPLNRAAAAHGLGRQGDKAASAVGDLALALKDANQGVRIKAALALGQIGPAAADASGALTQSLSDSDPVVRRQAASALGKLGVRTDVTVKARESGSRRIAHCAGRGGRGSKDATAKAPGQASRWQRIALAR